MVEFATPDGRRVEAAPTAVMRELDRVAVEATGPPLLSMMENAGRNLAGAVRERVDDGPVVVLAGGGNNGGGGLCAARHLANHDVPTRVVLDRPPAVLDGVRATQRDAATAAGVSVTDDLDPPLASASVVVDAVLGYGIDGAPRGDAADLVAAASDAAAGVVSLDVPTGVDPTTGDRPGAAVDPDLALTLALPNPGLAPLSCAIELADIGVPAGTYERAGVSRPPFAGRYRLPLERVS